MRRTTPIDLSPARLEREVGGATYERGVQYARTGAVTQAVWNAEARAMAGVVNGSGRSRYTTTAVFDDAGDFDYGECSCPMAFNCKHVVALVLSATSEPEPAAMQRKPDWEQSLGQLLEASLPSQGRTPIAVEFSLTKPMYGAPPRLQGRLLRQGKRGGWVAGDLTWSALDGMQYRGYDPAQVRLLRQLHSLARPVHAAASFHPYTASANKMLDLSSSGSPQLWPLLRRACQAGVRFLHSRHTLGDVPEPTEAQLCLDVTGGSSSAGLTVTPVIRVEQHDIDPVPVCFIGQEGHGIVFADRADAAADPDPRRWPLRLAELSTPAPAQLQRMVLDAAPLEIPADELPRFRDEFYPRLRHIAPVVSSDDAFTPPEISGPTLELVADYGHEHSLDLSWTWRYKVGGSQRRLPVDGSEAEAGVRDPAAERAIVEGLDASLREFGLLTGGPKPDLAATSSLGGVETMRFSTEILPLLDNREGVDVVVIGEPADYREVGDSLRIGVSASENDGDTDWFDLGVTISVEGHQVPFTDVFSALANDEQYLVLADGAFFSLQKPELQSLRRLIAEAKALRERADGPLQISRFQAGLWEELCGLGVVEHQASAWQRQVNGLLELPSLEPPPTPSAIDAELRPYQLDGYGWLTFLWRHGLGGILADDMGLGKTLQALTLISQAKQEDPGPAPFLIAAPASVVSNWTAEAGRFTPDLNVVALTETLARRGDSLAEAVRGADVVVVSYTLLRLEADAYAEATWSGMVLDEAQFAKNHKSKVYQTARRVPAAFKLAITGTPMENNLMELWSLLSITAPGLFPDPSAFKEYYARPIERGNDTELLGQLRRRIKPLVKRRTKEQVAADLPAKQEQVLDVDLHPRHRTIYQRHLQRERQKVLGLLDDLDGNRFEILRSLTLLRQLSLHPALVDDTNADVPCSKIDAMFEQLREVTAGGHRALVFSQFTGFLEHARRRLEEAGIEYCYLDGKTRRRAEVIRRFKGGSAPVFLISLKAGGFGLNLTEADYCFLLDPWWNPATEAQAVDRTHRIGQTRNVMVYRLIAADTIEEKVMALKARKAKLFASVMDDGDAFGSTLRADDIRALLEH